MPLMLASDIIVQEQKEGIEDNAVSIVVPDAVVYLPLEDLVDFEQEKERLTKEEERLNKEIKRAKGMLANEKFVSKAPEAKVQEERDKLEKYEQMLRTGENGRIKEGENSRSNETHSISEPDVKGFFTKVRKSEKRRY